ncbi:hypothetical protein ACHHYP_16668 [Achlya hypogyna]|uniref:Uncharacterized protein n=1 Tax=Achlya hypogyna TaxID=1202772 RepID=A0A1V9Y637_ACHHY|nr:hypothetical protein ACHHYP_16668 [Achlya hypogyna]
MTPNFDAPAFTGAAVTHALDEIKTLKSNHGSKTDHAGGSTSGGAATTKALKAGNSSDTKPKHPCLKCKSADHNISKCPHIPDNDNGVAEKALLKTFYDQQRTAALPHPRSRSSRRPTACDQLYGVPATPMTIPISVQLDSGADVTVVTRSWGDKALQAGCDIKPTPLAAHQRVLAFTGQLTTFSDKVALDVIVPAGSCWCLKAGEFRRIWDFVDLQQPDPAIGLPRINAIMAAPAAAMMDAFIDDGLETGMPTTDPLDA